MKPDPSAAPDLAAIRELLSEASHIDLLCDPLMDDPPCSTCAELFQRFYALLAGPQNREFAQNNPIWFKQLVSGGYGYEGRDVPARFVRVSGRRVTIEVELRDGTRKRISVSPKNIRPRELESGAE